MGLALFVLFTIVTSEAARFAGDGSVDACDGRVFDCNGRVFDAVLA